jgi:hypothetical protein
MEAIKKYRLLKAIKLGILNSTFSNAGNNKMEFLGNDDKHNFDSLMNRITTENQTQKKKKSAIPHNQINTNVVVAFLILAMIIFFVQILSSCAAVKKPIDIEKTTLVRVDSSKKVEVIEVWELTANEQ